VDDFGTITNLTFEANGVKGGGTPGTPAAPGAPNPAVPPPPPNPFGNPGVQKNFQRPLRLPGAAGGMRSGGAAQNNGGNEAFGAASAGQSYGATPSMTLGGQSVPFTGYGQQAQQQQQAATAGASPEVNAIMTEAAYQAAKAANDPTAAVFPPSALDPTRNLAVQPGAETTPGQTTPTTQPNQLPLPGRPPGFRPF